MQTIPFINLLTDSLPKALMEKGRLSHPPMELFNDIRCNLENLLNTPQPYIFLPAVLELQGALVDYGLPSFFHYELIKEETGEEFCNLLEALISCYEPRLTNVKVFPDVVNQEQTTNFVKFFLEGEILWEDNSKSVIFSSQLEFKKSHFLVSPNIIQ